MKAMFSKRLNDVKPLRGFALGRARFSIAMNPLRGLGRMGTPHGCYCYESPTEIGQAVRYQGEAEFNEVILCSV